MEIHGKGLDWHARCFHICYLTDKNNVDASVVEALDSWRAKSEAEVGYIWGWGSWSKLGSFSILKNQEAKVSHHGSVSWLETEQLGVGYREEREQKESRRGGARGWQAMWVPKDLNLVHSTFFADLVRDRQWLWVCFGMLASEKWDGWEVAQVGRKMLH